MLHVHNYVDVKLPREQICCVLKMLMYSVVIYQTEYVGKESGVIIMNFCYQYECDVSIMSACITIPMVCSFCSFDERSWYTEDYKLSLCILTPAVTMKDMLEVALYCSAAAVSHLLMLE